MNASRSNGTLLHVLDHALPEVSGYSVRSHNLLRALRAAGLDVLAVSSSSPVQDAIEDEIDGVRYVRLPFRSEDAPHTASILWRRIVHFGRWLATAVEQHGVTLLHAHSPVLNAFPALWAARRRRRPLIYEVRSFWEDTVLDRDLSDELTLRYRLTRAMETWALQRTDAVMTICQGMRDEIIDRGVPAQRVHIAANAVDSIAFRPRVADAELVERHRLTGRFVVGFIGFFHYYEGVEVLIDGFARMLRGVPEARLLLIGKGPCEAMLKEQAERLGVGANVIFTGAAPHSDVSRYYALCDVVVYPRLSRRSTELTTPLKPLEAMAMAKPVVASNVGGLRELVRDNETGMLFPAGDPQGLSEALTLLAAEPMRRTRLAENARRFVCAERTWERSVQSYLELYATLLHSTSQRR